MNDTTSVKDLPADIDPVWAGDGSHLPEWFIAALRVPREEAYVEISGAKVHYFRWGNRDKPKLLMTHGFLAHARCFAFIAPFFAQDYDIVAFDLAGMGDSEMRGSADTAARGKEFTEIAEAFLANDAAVQVRSDHELSATIVSLMGDPVRRARLGAAARALVPAV